MKKIVLFIVLVGAVFLSGCVYTDGQRQSVYQGGTTALGALTGQMLGGDTESTLIGGAVGYVAGGLTKEWVHPQQTQSVVVQHQSVGQYNHGRIGYIPPPRLMPPTGNARRWAQSPRDRAYYQAKDQIYRQEYRRWERQERSIGRAEGELDAYRNLNRNRFFYRQ